MTVTNFPNGVSCTASGDALAAFPLAVPNTYGVLQNDFFELDTTDTWTFTNTNATATVSGSVGVVDILTAGADNDKGQLSMTDVGVSLVSGKKAAFSTRFKVGSDAGTNGLEGIIIGLTTGQTGTNLISADGTSLAFDDGVVFYSSPASSFLQVASRASDTETRVSLASDNVGYTEDLWQRIDIVYDGTQLKFYYGTDSAVNLVKTITTNIPTAALTPTLYIEAGEAVAKTLSVDYITLSLER